MWPRTRHGINSIYRYGVLLLYNVCIVLLYTGMTYACVICVQVWRMRCWVPYHLLLDCTSHFSHLWLISSLAPPTRYLWVRTINTLFGTSNQVSMGKNDKHFISIHIVSVTINIYKHNKVRTLQDVLYDKIFISIKTLIRQRPCRTHERVNALTFAWFYCYINFTNTYFDQIIELCFFKIYLKYKDWKEITVFQPLIKYH